MSDKKIKYRRARVKDKAICVKFTDDFLAGRWKGKIEGAGNDYFVTPMQHLAYLSKSIVWLAFDGRACVGWAVKGTNQVLIHLLVHPSYRKRGIGSELLKRCNPDIIRSKTDQSTGNPASFYASHGYASSSDVLAGKKRNIELFSKGRKQAGN